MARSLRIEYANGLYHVTSRGNARMDIYLNDTHRIEFLALLAKTINRFNWICHAYCLMSNHYHLLIETIDPTLSKGMKYLNGTYSQFYNRSRGRVGHVFQGRYKGIIVEKEAYLLELSRYIVLNPVRAHMVSRPEDWIWSSYRGAIGLDSAHLCLDSHWLLSLFGDNPSTAKKRYQEFVGNSIDASSPLKNIKNQIYLGSDNFIALTQSQISEEQSFDDIPKPQRRCGPRPLSDYVRGYSNRREGMARAYLSGHYTLKAVGHAFNVSYATVARAVAKIEE